MCPFRARICFWCLALAMPGCGAAPPEGDIPLVMAGGSGPEETLARKQLREFHRLNPDIRVTYRAAPSSASDRQTLYITWLSSHSSDIDILNLDVIWVPEFAAAGLAPPRTFADLLKVGGLKKQSGLHQEPIDGKKLIFSSK